MNSQIEQPLVDKVYVLTKHEARNNDSDEVYYVVLGVYNSKEYAHQQMLSDYTSTRDEEPLDYDYDCPEDFWDDDWTDATSATLNQDAYPIYYHWEIKEMEIK